MIEFNGLDHDGLLQGLREAEGLDAYEQSLVPLEHAVYQCPNCTASGTLHDTDVCSACGYFDGEKGVPLEKCPLCKKTLWPDDPTTEYKGVEVHRICHLSRAVEAVQQWIDEHAAKYDKAAERASYLMGQLKV